MSRKDSQEYIDGYSAETARIAVKHANRSAQDAHPSLSSIAREVANHLGRDHARKNRILAASPHLAYAFDAEELGKMSSSQLARYELKQLGINCSDNSDPLEVRDAFHAGRMHERQSASGSRNPAMSAAQDSRSNGGDSFVDNYLKD